MHRVAQCLLLLRLVRALGAFVLFGFSPPPQRPPLCSSDALTVRSLLSLLSRMRSCRKEQRFVMWVPTHRHNYDGSRLTAP